MFWLHPTAWLAVAALAAPLAIHLLAHRRAEPLDFPTLRFIRPTRLAAIRRRALEDLGLLFVRAAILAAAVAALAGPLLVTPARRAAWNGRLVRAIVTSSSTTDTQRPTQEAEAFRTERFIVDSLAEGVHRAVAWLEAAPPARRELVIAAPLAIGSIEDRDIATVPAGAGIRFERTAALPPERTLDGGIVLNQPGSLRRTLRLSANGTIVTEEQQPGVTRPPIEIAGPVEARGQLDAALAAVVSQQMALPAADRRAQVVAVRASAASIDGAPIRTAWMADAVARIARDPDLQIEASRTRTGIADSALRRAPWYPLTSAADGRPLAVAAASRSHDRLVVVVREEGTSDPVAPVLLRSIANSLAPSANPSAGEVIPIPDAQLRAWTRPPAASAVPRIDTVERDDRGWPWVLVLALLAVETALRRIPRRSQDESQPEEVARVA